MQTSDLIKDHILSGIESKTTWSAISLGGGPGVEALALMDQLRNCDGRYNLTFNNIDLRASWKPIYHDLVRTFAKWVKNIDITPQFCSIDIKRNFTAGQYDVVFVSWILSEMNDGDRPGVLAKALKLARSDGHIVITDRPEQALVAGVTTRIKELPGWTLIHHDPRWKRNCGIKFPSESEPFGPKYECDTARWVLKKPQNPNRVLNVNSAPLGSAI